MSEEVVGVQNHRLDSGVVNGAVGVDGQVLVLVISTTQASGLFAISLVGSKNPLSRN